MSNTIDEIKRQEEEAERRSAAAALVKRDKENAKKEVAVSQEPEKDNDIEDAIANAYPDESEKREKILKGIYLDDDVLAVYKAVSAKKPRGWGSQLTSDLLRAEFVKQGLMKK